MWPRHTYISLVLIVPLVVAGCGNENGGGEDGADTDDLEVVDTGDTHEPDTLTDTVEDMPLDEEVEDVEAEDSWEEEVRVPGCGDGILDTDLGEVCDDGNSVTEPCDTTDEAPCLSDCTLDMSLCGNTDIDLGEMCDDGDDDSMDECTTSCNFNTHDIGAPCACTAGCQALNFTAGTIEGCGAASFHADSTRTLACVRSSRDDTHGVEVYGARGFCTLLAVGCTGTLCFMVPTTGDVDAFDCPAGNAVLTEERSLMGMIITAKSCHPVCDSQDDCRWNATELSGSPFEGRCGQYACLSMGDGGESICVDPRNST
jgi:hypothetical protein